MQGFVNTRGRHAMNYTFGVVYGLIERHRHKIKKVSIVIDWCTF